MGAPAPVGYPYGPPVPMPYMPAVIVKPETVSGIRTYQISLVLDIVFAVFALTVGLTAVLVTASDSNSAISLAAILGASVCGLVIVFILNFIVSLMSVMKMHHGADEYGPEHAKNATRGVLFKWMGTALSTIATVLVVYLAIVGSFALLGGGGVPPAAFIPLLVTAFWTAGVTCKGQMYRHMVRALQPPELRFRADLASLLIPALGVVGIGVIGFVTYRLVTLLQSLDSLSNVAVDTINKSRDDIVADLTALAPILRRLADAGQNLPQALEILPTFPFTDPVLDGVKGDYLNLFIDTYPEPGFTRPLPPLPLPPSGQATPKAGAR